LEERDGETLGANLEEQTHKLPEERHFNSPEQYLSARDSVLKTVMAAQFARWPSAPTEDPIWGLVRIVMAQQVSTHVACQLAERAITAHPRLIVPSTSLAPDPSVLCAIGLSKRRAECCSNIVQHSDEIRCKVKHGQTWSEALAGIKGIGPWTIAVFRIMVLREPDVLPLGDIGLGRAIKNVYGEGYDVQELAQKWRPFRSVACWYLWRTLGNKQLG
jgi:DNA-3-methyladenine glycosylase II